MVNITEATQRKIQQRMQLLYGASAEEPTARLIELLNRQAADTSFGGATLTGVDALSRHDVVLITYGDQLSEDAEPPLSTLRKFLLAHDLTRQFSHVHLLPFFPYTSDDGFSVVDYRQVDAALGDWDDIAALAKHFDLVFDFVLNHCSVSSKRFQAFLACDPSHHNDFITVDPATDLSQVVRPRSLPLLTEFETDDGPRHVWTTFSADQVDLNFAEPDVLLAMLEILLFYAEQGAKVIRLDAIAYLWKEIGTTCIHLPQTHEVVKLMRDVLDAVCPGVMLLSETNVPHAENVSYFGNGDEAHLVYQFSLAPLLLDAFLFADATPINQWLENLEAPPSGCSYFNFTASHDGVGVRPLEGLVDSARRDRLVGAIQALGGRVSYKSNADGSQTPYELNITYYSALGGNFNNDQHVARFLATQAVMVALQGIPGVYFHSLVGTQNDVAGAEASGINRRINRRKFSRAEIEDTLADDSPQAAVFAGYQRLLATRRQQPALTPNSPQEFVSLDPQRTIAFLRRSQDGKQAILVAVNVTAESITVALPAEFTISHDLLSSDTPHIDDASLTLNPFQVVWLEADAG